MAYSNKHVNSSSEMKISDGNSSPNTKLPEVWQVVEGEMTIFLGVSEIFQFETAMMQEFSTFGGLFFAFFRRYLKSPSNSTKSPQVRRFNHTDGKVCLQK